MFCVFLYTSPQISAPNILPGNAIRLPSPRRFRISAAANAAPSPYPGPKRTAQRIFTICCTGEHLLPNTGNENKLPATATAQKTAATANFFVFVCFMFYSA